MPVVCDINKDLYKAAIECDFDQVEELLKRGADPLGAPCDDPKEYMLETLFWDATENETLAAALPRMIELFYGYGMDIKERNIPKYDGNQTHPLSTLRFCQDENGLKILKTLLDHNLDTDSAEVFVDEILMDMAYVDIWDMEDPQFVHRTVCALKMVMLVASYPHVVAMSEYVRNSVALADNLKENLAGFRNWDNYEYHIDTETCTNGPHGLLDATVSIVSILTKDIVWHMKIR